jgi:hypothetical protein
LIFRLADNKLPYSFNFRTTVELLAFSLLLDSPCPGPNRFKITTPISIRAIPVILAPLIFSFQIKTEIIVVATIPIPDQRAYAVFSGIVFNDNDKKKKEHIKAMIKPIVGRSLENPSEALSRDVPKSSKVIANARYTNDIYYLSSLNKLSNSFKTRELSFSSICAIRAAADNIFFSFPEIQRQTKEPP